MGGFQEIFQAVEIFVRNYPRSTLGGGRVTVHGTVEERGRQSLFQGSTKFRSEGIASGWVWGFGKEPLRLLPRLHFSFSCSFSPLFGCSFERIYRIRLDITQGIAQPSLSTQQTLFSRFPHLHQLSTHSRRMHAITPPTSDFSYSNLQELYSQGIPCPSDFSFPKNVIDGFAKSQGDVPAIWWVSHDFKKERKVSYEELSRESKKAAKVFRKNGIKKGDKSVLNSLFRRDVFEGRVSVS